MSSELRPREVPDHRSHILAPRRHAHALVIPVINEGERIRAELNDISSSRPPVDVVIADGGSTDNSLDLDFLRACGVRALLVKTGRGALSAQLRMAYAFCLDEGYEGIITIDGNHKDGSEAIPAFVDKLNEGYGYIQGSRYRLGGQSINTPLDRYFAGRFIHAPLISLAAGHWYTDTTNGFRAYSRAYLLDPRTAPFRAEFDRYALLFYLSIRASQLGYRTCEIPVVRRYPDQGRSPTKIDGVKGRARMLKELLATVLGRFNVRG